MKWNGNFKKVHHASQPVTAINVVTSLSTNDAQTHKVFNSHVGFIIIICTLSSFVLTVHKTIKFIFCFTHQPTQN